jgi:hypothetical protein
MGTAMKGGYNYKEGYYMSDDMSEEAYEVDNQSLNNPTSFSGRPDAHTIELLEDMPAVMLVSKERSIAACLLSSVCLNSDIQAIASESMSTSTCARCIFRPRI